MEKCVTDWNMVVAIVGSNIALVAIFVGFILWAFSKLDGDIKALGNKLDGDIKALGTKVDGDIKALGSLQDADRKAQTARTDQLYQMFIDLLREQKGPKTNP